MKSLIGSVQWFCTSTKVGILATVTYKKLVVYYYELHCCYVSKTEVCLLCDQSLTPNMHPSALRNLSWNYDFYLNKKHYTGVCKNISTDILVLKCHNWSSCIITSPYGNRAFANNYNINGYGAEFLTYTGTETGGWLGYYYSESYIGGYYTYPPVPAIDIIL